MDKAYTVPGFAAGRIFRPTRAITTPGGKGINVARVYQALGGAATATGFLGGANGDFIENGLRAEGMPTAFVRVGDESRVCIKAMDPDSGVETELNEVGPEVTPAEADALLARLWELLPGRDAVMLSGSLPPGPPPGLYRDIITRTQEEFGVKAILDTSGSALTMGAQAVPFLLKPNVHELSVLGVGGDGWTQSVLDLRRKYGVALAMITGGARGAVVASEDGLWEASPPRIPVVSAVGSGDSLTAAFVWALGNGYTVAEALCLGVAAGAANAMTEASGFCTRETIFELAAHVQVNTRGGNTVKTSWEHLVTVAFMMGGPADWMIIMVVALIVFGPKKLPEVGKQLGQAMREFRKMTDELTGAAHSVRDEVENAWHAPPAGSYHQSHAVSSPTVEAVTNHRPYDQEPEDLMAPVVPEVHHEEPSGPPLDNGKLLNPPSPDHVPEEATAKGH